MARTGPSGGSVPGRDDDRGPAQEGRHQRWETALRRSAEEALRAEAARRGSEAARQWADAARRLADSARRRTGAVAEERTRGEGEPGAGDNDEWGALALRRATIQSEFLARSSARLASQAELLRVQAAELADRMADQAQSYADYLERSDQRRNVELRHAIARTERLIAGMEQQMAAKLRALDVRYTRGDPLPKLPRAADDEVVP